jgi:transcriptional regulator with XRE-family HTH domain
MVEMNLELLAVRLKSARKLRHKTLDEVASSVGMNKSTIQRYEAGLIQSPKMPVLREVARYLSVNLDWLTGDSEDMEILSPEDDLDHYLEMLETRPEVRALLKSVDGAKPEDVRAVMDFFTALRNNES